MRLFGYYALHTLKNQIRKLLKTWVLLFFVACFALGGIIGLGTAMLEDAAEERAAMETGGTPEEEPEGPSFLESQGIAPEEMLELALGGLVLALLAYETQNAGKNGSKIFLPADVNLLFASPLSPQAVLMFRLSTQLGVALLSVFYFLIQVPNLVLNLGMGLWTALALVLDWCLCIMAGKLLQVLLYLCCSNHPSLRGNLRRGLWVFLGLLGGAFLLFWRRGEDWTPFQAAVAFFNAPGTRWIPLWGWLKGFVCFAGEGRPLEAIACFLGILAAGWLLLFLIRNTKADFYEDAMAKSEETAELLERVRSETAGLVTGKRKKERSAALWRDGMRFGSGANVFFFKSLYNRFRFGHLHFFTKTGETYLAAAVLVSLFCRFGLETGPLLPVALCLAALVFFRTLGNPLEEDTRTVCFRMVPERCQAKLLYSMLGGTVNCLLDLLPALLVAAVVSAEPLLALAWLPFLLSIDFYATATGTFIHLSVPVSAGNTVKQLTQILFIYFGLLPDVGIIAAGLVFDYAAPAVAGSALLNLFLGLVFFHLAPLFLEPKEGNQIMESMEPEKTVDLKAARKQFSRMGGSIFAILVASFVLSVAVSVIFQFVDLSGLGTSLTLLLALLPQYVLAFPLGLLLLRRVPAASIEQRPCGGGRLLSAFLICYFLIYVGNYIGVLVNGLLQSTLDSSGINPVEEIAMGGDSLLIQALCLAVIAPVLEELVFRKALIDRMYIYGEKTALVTSALMFALFHGNVSQVFYAFALGLVSGYLYLRTGRLRYSIGLHVLVNAMGGVLAPFLLERVDLEALEALDFADPEALMTVLNPGIIVYLVYAIVLVMISLAGLITLIVQARNIHFAPAEQELPKGSRFRTVWLNAGMLLLLAGCLGMFVYYALS